MRTRRSTSATSTGGRSSTPEASQIANAKFDVRVCRRWIFEDKFATIMDPRPQGLRQRLVVKFGGGSTMANGNVSGERFFLTHKMFNASYDLFGTRSTKTVRFRTAEPRARTRSTSTTSVHRTRSQLRRIRPSVPRCILCAGFL